MAYRVSNINPIDLKPQVAVGISLPFNGPTGFNSTYTTYSQLKTNIINYLLTNRGERVFNYNMGSDISKLIFSQITDLTIEELRLIISSKLESIFPIKITKLNIIPIKNDNYIELSFEYSVKGTNTNDNITIAYN